MNHAKPVFRLLPICIGTAFLLMGGFFMVLGQSPFSDQSPSTDSVRTTEAHYVLGQPMGRLESREIREASGLVASATAPGFLWTHNDSGDAARIFLLDSLARHRGTYYLSGATALDWEEMGHMRLNDRDYLIVGDIGDNRARRPFVTIYIFPESALPEDLLAASNEANLPASSNGQVFTDSIPAELIQTVRLRYQDGAQDAEAFFFDESDGLLYVITKREAQVAVYSTVLPFLEKKHAGGYRDTLTLQRRVELPLTWVTAADISRAGNEILIKNLLQVHHWARLPGETVIQALSRPSVRLPYRLEPQGEAISFHPEGKGYYTLSERPLGLPVSLNYSEKRSGAAPTSP